MIARERQAVSARGKARDSPATRRVSPETNRVVENIQGGIASRSIAVGARPRRWMTSRLETADRQGGTVTRAGGNTCGPPSARLDLKPPRSRGRIRTTPNQLSHRHRCQVARSRGLPRAGGSGLLSDGPAEAIRVGSLRARVGHGYWRIIFSSLVSRGCTSP